MTISPYAKELLPIVASSAGAVVVKADHPDAPNIHYFLSLSTPYLCHDKRK
jgi:hypothetical protein